MLKDSGSVTGNRATAAIMQVSTSSNSELVNQSFQYHIYAPPEWFQTYDEFQVILSSVLHAGAIVCGGFILLTMGCARRLHSASNMVLASLALADMLVAVVMTIDKYANSDKQGRYSSWAVGTLINTALPQFPLLATHIHTIIIAVERYIAVTRPLRYDSIWTPKKVGMILAATWGMSVILSSSSLAWGAIWESPRVSRMPTVRSLLTSIICYCLGATAVAVLYARILTVAHQQRRKIQQMQVHVIQVESDSDPYPRSTSQRSRGSRLFSAIVVAIFLCWGPFFAVTVAIEYVEHVELYHYAMQGMALSFALSHYLFNFAIYVCKSEDFRKAFKLVLLCRLQELRQG